jgi:hypothetical protein
LLEIVAMVTGGRLELDWVYSRNIHDRETMDHLARTFIETLQLLIRHCCAPGSRGFTPADFPQAKLNQKNLDKLGQLITERNPNAAKDSVTDIYDPCSRACYSTACLISNRPHTLNNSVVRSKAT